MDTSTVKTTETREIIMLAVVNTPQIIGGALWIHFFLEGGTIEKHSVGLREQMLMAVAAVCLVFTMFDVIIYYLKIKDKNIGGKLAITHIGYFTYFLFPSLLTTLLLSPGALVRAFMEYRRN